MSNYMPLLSSVELLHVDSCLKLNLLLDESILTLLRWSVNLAFGDIMLLQMGLSLNPMGMQVRQMENPGLLLQTMSWFDLCQLF